MKGGIKLFPWKDAYICKFLNETEESSLGVHIEAHAQAAQ